jgi:hypothetical protein
MSENGGSQLHSEKQASATSASANFRASDLAGPTTQAQQAAGSCEPTTHASASATRQPTPLNSDDDDDVSEDQKRALAPAKRKASKGTEGRATAPGNAKSRAGSS